MVGEMGFEPMTFWSRTKRATRLRYSPFWPEESAKRLLNMIAKRKGNVNTEFSLCGRKFAIKREMAKFLASFRQFR